MDAAFAEIQFNEAGAAAANLAILRTRLSQQLWERLPTLLAQLPSPDDALNFLERYLRDAPASVTRHLDTHPAALHYLLSLFSFSRFLSESLVQEPELILWMDRRGPNEGLERMKSRDDVLEDCYRFSTMAYDSPPAVFLARFKRREYLRITLRDVLNLASLSDTCLELSNLADVLIERALRLCAVKLEALYGVPQWRDTTGHLQPARLTVMALGKLGGQELNYSSDIDLIFLYDRDGETAGGEAGAISNLEYFVRLAQAIVKMLGEATPEGAVFRIDTRLRPEGQQGDLAVSYAAALEYYRTRGREWELQMLIKARATAGELSTAEALLRELHARIYPKEVGAGIVRAVTDARAEISRVLEQRAGIAGDDSALWNVKLSPGGIRDIEFIAQCLQRLHGGRDAWVSGRGAGTTLVALQHLHDKGYLSQRDFYRLSAAYEFLRKVEHRLQLRDGLQEHLLPRKAEARNRIARRSGVDARGENSAGEELLAKVRRHFEEVREIYERVVRTEGASPRDDDHEPRKYADFAYAKDSRLARVFLEHRAILERLERWRAQGDVFARRGLGKYLEAASSDAPLMQELDGSPETLDRAAMLFSRSDFATETLVREPRAIARIGDSPQQDSEKQHVMSFPRSMTSLRITHREAAFSAAARSILGEAKPFETFAELTRAAENAVRETLALAVEEEKPAASGRAGNDAPFVVLALGRLGAGEFDIGSDADLAFFATPNSQNEMEGYRRLAERFIRAAGSYTSEGLLLPVDTRLRPRGGEGEIVQTAAYLLDYFASEAQAWEAATYLKARPVAGNVAFGEKLLEELREVLRRRFSAAHGRDARALAAELAHMRDRVERERAEGATGFKSAAGGFFDIEYVIAYAALSQGEFAAVPKNVIDQIDGLERDAPLGKASRDLPSFTEQAPSASVQRKEASGALRAEDARVLREAATFYRSLDHAIRLVLGRSLSALPEPAQIPRVNALLKQWGVSVASSLHDALAITRHAVRQVYKATVVKDPQ